MTGHGPDHYRDEYGNLIPRCRCGWTDEGGYYGDSEYIGKLADRDVERHAREEAEEALPD